MRAPRALGALRVPLALRVFAWAAGIALLAAACAWIAAPLLARVPAWWDERDPPSLSILDRDGGRLALVRRDAYVRGGDVEIGRIPSLVVHATLAAEDRRFFGHHGVDLLALGRAARDCLARGGRGGLRGASTITMQAVRLRRGAPRSLAGRLEEVFWSLVIERHRAKEEILERYLAAAPYGAQVYGVEEGSLRWFGASAAFLSPAQAALLAALPRNPARCDPIRHPGRARAARDAVLLRMQRAGFLDREDAERAIASPLGLHPSPPRGARHFADWVAGRVARAEITSEAAVVRTTLDPWIQDLAERALREEVDRLAPAHARSGAVVVLDNARSEVLAMVGSPSYEGAEAGQFNAALARRQPGSAVKPFTYAAAFAGDLRPSSILADVPVAYADRDGTFAPRNYAGGHAGPVSARSALANSWNVPAVEALQRAGMRETARLYEAFGLLAQEDAERAGLGLTLGAGETSLLDLACAYASLARGGVVRPARVALASRDRAGRDLPLREAEPVRVLDPVSCYWVLDILSDAAARAAAFGRGGPLETPYPSAAKTGTSSDWRDAWAVLTTSRRTVAVWMGDPGGRPMDEVTGVRGPAIVARRILDRLETREPSEPFPVPAGIERRLVCVASGLAAGPDCTQPEWEQFRSADPALRRCDVHASRRIDRATGLLARTCTPPSRLRRQGYAIWPDRFALHASAHGAPPAEATPCECGRADCRILDEPAVIRAAETPWALVRILRPVPGSVYVMDPSLPPAQQKLACEAAAPQGARLAWSVDGREIGTTEGIHRIFWALEAGRHTIRAEARGHARCASEFEVLASDGDGDAAGRIADADRR